MEAQLQKPTKTDTLSRLRKADQIYIGLSTWYSPELHGSTSFGSVEDFKKHFYRAIIKLLPSETKSRKYRIFIAGLNKAFNFTRDALLNTEQYILLEADLPNGFVIHDQLVSHEVIFPRPRKGNVKEMKLKAPKLPVQVVNEEEFEGCKKKHKVIHEALDQPVQLVSVDELRTVETETIEELRAFKTTVLSGGIRIKTWDEEVFDEITDRASKYFYCSSQRERIERLSRAPLPIFLIPIKDNAEYFSAVFASSENPCQLIEQHHEKYESVRMELASIFAVESQIMDPCLLFNRLLSYCGERISGCMTRRKKRSSTQFFVILPYEFAFKILPRAFLVAGWEQVTTNHNDGRIVLRAKSRFVFENTIASSHNQLTGKVITRKFVYLNEDQQTGLGYAEEERQAAVVTKSPYDMEKSELLKLMEEQGLFEDEEEMWRAAPTYELAQKVFEWVSGNGAFFGVEYFYGVCNHDGSFSDMVIVPEKHGFGMARVVIMVFLSKFKIEFSEEKKKDMSL